MVEHLPQLELNLRSGLESQDHTEELGWLEPSQDKAVFCGVLTACVQEPHDAPFVLVLPTFMFRQASFLHVQCVPCQPGLLRQVLNFRRWSERAITESEASL